MTGPEAANIVNMLFRDWYSFLVRFATRPCGSVSAAEDMVQQAFLELYTALLKGTEIHNPRAWTLQVIRRCTYRKHNEARRGPEFIDDLEESLDVATSLPSVDETLQWIDVQRMLCVLTPREEEVLLLRLQALKYREIAEVLGITTQSVSTLLMRAISKLKRVAGVSGAQTGTGAGAEFFDGPGNGKTTLQ